MYPLRTFEHILKHVLRIAQRRQDIHIFHQIRALDRIAASPSAWQAVMMASFNCH